MSDEPSAFEAPRREHGFIDIEADDSEDDPEENHRENVARLMDGAHE